MPDYEYRCESCSNLFSKKMSMEEHARADLECPVCRKKNVVQQYSVFCAKTSKKS